MIRVLLDEDVDVRFRLKFGAETEVETVSYRGWKGIKNGELLHAAAEHFDVLVTLDANLPAQQDLSKHDLAVVVLRPRSQALDDLTELLPDLERAIVEAKPGTALEVRAREV